MFKAVKANNVAELKVLLNKDGIDVNATTTGLFDSGRTALHLATENGNTECVGLLLAHKNIDVNARTINGVLNLGDYTPLHLAAASGKTECLRLLLSASGIDVNSQTTGGMMKGMTPLHSAVDTGTIECVKLLLEHRGIDVNVQNEKGLTALHLAVENVFTGWVRELLSDKRINVDIATNKGETHLKLAEHSDNAHKQEILSLLQFHRKIKQDQVTFNSKADSTSPFSSKHYLVVLFIFLLIVCVVVVLHK